MFGCGKIRNRNLIHFGIVVLVTLMAAGLLLLLRSGAQRPGAYVVVMLGGEEYSRYPLAVDGVYEIRTEGGGYNILAVRDRMASVTEADCANQVCVHMKPIKYAGEMITCLPHQMQIRIEGGEQAAYDAITN